MTSGDRRDDRSGGPSGPPSPPADLKVRRYGRTAGAALAVARKELRQIGRDRTTLLTLLFVPAFFLLVYGYALNFDIRHVRLAVQDNDRSSASRELISAFVNSGYFDLAADVTSSREVTAAIDQDLARAVLVIPPRFGADAGAGRPTRVQMLRTKVPSFL